MIPLFDLITNGIDVVNRSFLYDPTKLESLRASILRLRSARGIPGTLP
jgi:hypothetical protein